MAAGLEAWWTQFRNPKTGPGEGPYGIRVFLPSGRRFHGVSLHGGDEAEVLLKFPFERWTVLQGYEAILDPDQRRIVSGECRPAVMRKHARCSSHHKTSSPTCPCPGRLRGVKIGASTNAILRDDPGRTVFN